MNTASAQSLLSATSLREAARLPLDALSTVCVLSPYRYEVGLAD